MDWHPKGRKLLKTWSSFSAHRAEVKPSTVRPWKKPLYTSPSPTFLLKAGPPLPLLGTGSSKHQDFDQTVESSCYNWFNDN